MIAGWASRDNIRPNVLAAHVPGNDVVDGHVERMFSAILAHVVVSPENLAPGELEPGARAGDHLGQSDDRWNWQAARNRPDFSATVHHQRGLVSQQQAQSPVKIADMDGFKIGIENQHRYLHVKIIARGFNLNM